MKLQSQSLLSLQEAHNGLPLLLANIGRISIDEFSELSEGDIRRVSGAAAQAVQTLGGIMELIGRLIAANETADAALRVPSADIARLWGGWSGEIGAALRHLSDIRVSYAQDAAFLEAHALGREAEREEAARQSAADSDQALGVDKVKAERGQP